MITQERTLYDREFKQKAVEFSYAKGNTKEIAEELEIQVELLYRWRRKLRSMRIIVSPVKENSR